MEKIVAQGLRKSTPAAKSTQTRKQELFELVRYLHARGHSTRRIAKGLNLSRGTVMRYIKADRVPDWGRRAPRRSKLEKYDHYLRQRWREGERNSSTLWKELQQQGYEGQYNSVHKYLRRYRENKARSVRQTAWLFMKKPNALLTEDEDYLQHLFDQSPTLKTAYQLTQTFLSMLSNRSNLELDDWLVTAENCGLKTFANFAFGLRQDYAAVREGLQSVWSNGQTEGQVTRLKLIKRQMYGRANFDLLRIRVLGPP